jgi:hypothetical protein
MAADIQRQQSLSITDTTTELKDTFGELKKAAAAAAKKLVNTAAKAAQGAVNTAAKAAQGAVNTAATTATGVIDGTSGSIGSTKGGCGCLSDSKTGGKCGPGCKCGCNGIAGGCGCSVSGGCGCSVARGKPRIHIGGGKKKTNTTYKRATSPRAKSKARITHKSKNRK